MKLTRTALLLMAGLALAACNNPNRFGADGAAGGAAGGAGAGAGSALPGSAGDPASPAYFQQAVGDRVLFLVDQSSLTPEGINVLNGQATWLQTNSDYTAVIEGHADEQGTREYNLALGARRANAVKEYLVSRGVAESRLRTVTYGKERPIEICSNEACYAKNRRAVTVLAAGLTS
ncbi:peptidoglycan-associated lipoprotein Pal [Sulfitobacter sp. D35]|uniref:peptidoglycan-associated lipoprotein Pal n=1 Tax=Sulfitobacter sp. D35 TaxID=3083252 RepID=UPI00296E4D1D|nr:peptidoglycan-associated lipoprotein Pal [Sulfitobacter sp. D35]MDW4499504.1 peptidoglycan-associated lipoprotein Pal [Sulfitobacter sp. D35]